jgi:hypothetical protein
MMHAHGAYTILNFMVVKVAVLSHVRAFTIAIHFNPSLIFAGKAGAYQSRAPFDTPL